MVEQYPSLRKVLLRILHFVSYQCKGLIDLFAEYTPGAGAGIQSRSKASLKQLFHEFDLNIFKVYEHDFIKYE